MIALDSVASRRPPLSRGNVTVAWGPGVHALVGTPADGVAMVLALVAGRERLRVGKMTVLGFVPDDPRVRTQVAFVPRVPSLPAALGVGEALALAASVRGEPARSPVERLARLGIEALAGRRVRSLAPDEARAVALAEAVTSTVVRVLLLDEPLVGMDPRAVGRVGALLRERADAACAVVIGTASVRDAGELADHHVLLQAGKVIGRAGSLDALAAFTPNGARMRVVSSDATALLAALAREPTVEALARRGEAIVARGSEATELAQAVARAVLESGVEVVEMHLDPPTLDEARAATAGVAQATFDAARSRTERALATAVRPPEAP